MAEGVFNLDWNETFPRLSRPPIVEAVIHWSARAQQTLDPEGLALALAQRLSRYPIREPIQKLEFMATVSSEEGSPVVQHQKGWQGVRLKSEDGRYVIQFTRDGLVFSRTKEYQNWGPFVEAAKEAWQAYVDIAAPVETQRLGVRFINHIATATAEVLRDYLKDPPTCPSHLTLNDFIYQSTFGVPGHPFGVRVIKAMQPPIPELQQSSGLFLDTDVFSTNAIPNQASALDEALAKMRWLKNKIFFSLLTRDAVDSFK